MSDVTEDLRILYRAVTRRPGPAQSIEYAGCITAEEAVRLKRMGVARIVDVQTTEDDEAATDVQKAKDVQKAEKAERSPEALTVPPPPSDWIRVSLEATRADGAEGTSALPAALRLEAADNEMLMFLSRSADCSHAAATLAAQAGFCCVLNILDGRERYRSCETGHSSARLVQR